jgi:tetratricopeptide (TPR) repeat protein
VAALLRRELDFSPPELSPLDKLLHLLRSKAPRLDEQQAVPLLSAVLQMDTSEFYPTPLLTPQSQRALTFEVLHQLVLAMTQIKPCMLVVDGYEWLDPTSQEWLQELMLQCTQVRLLILLTSRQSRLTTQAPLALERLSPVQADELVTRLIEQLNARSDRPFSLSAESRRVLIERADGIPFYLEELARTAFLRRTLDGLPGRLHDFLMARLDDLGISKLTAQQAATIGRRFSRHLVSALANSDVNAQVDQLVDEGVVAPLSHGGELAFVQNLLREACYDSLLISVRQKYHGQVAQVLTQQFPQWAHQNPGLIAHHYLHSAQPSEAISWLAQALVRSLACCALSEAVAASHQALEQLDRLPADHPLQAFRLKLLTLQGSAWIGLRGYAAPEVESCYQQARQLCAALGDSIRVFPVLAGLWGLYLVQGKLALAEGLSQRLLEVSAAGTHHFRVACATRGQTRFFQGHLTEAADYLERAVQQYQPAEGRGESLAYLLTEPSIASASYLAYNYLLQGRPDKAREMSQQARSWAEQLDHPHTLAHTLSFEAWLLISLGEPAAALELAQQLESLSRQQSFPLWLAMAHTFAGSSRLALGDREGASQLHQGLLAGQSTGAQLGASWMLANLAQVVGAGGDLPRALELIEQALGLAHQTGERYYRPELLRLKSQWVDAELAEGLLAEARQEAKESGGRWFLQRLG